MGTAEVKKRGRPKKAEVKPKEAEASTEPSKEELKRAENNFYRNILERIAKKEDKGLFHTIGIAIGGAKFSLVNKGIMQFLNRDLYIVNNVRELTYERGYSLDEKTYVNNYFVATMRHSKARSSVGPKEVKGPYYDILSKDANAQRIWLALKAQIYLHDPIMGGTLGSTKLSKEMFTEALFTTLLFADYSKFPMNNKAYLNGNPIEAMLHIVSAYIVKEIILK